MSCLLGPCMQVPTYVQMSQQALPPTVAAQCGTMAYANCTRDWMVTNSSTVFVPIIDLMLITVAHSFGSSIGIDGDGLQMQGVLLGPGGAPLDPCSVYPPDIFTAGCPPQVQRAFSKGSFTTIPIRALMQAAGIFSLDEAPSTFGQPPPAVNNITRRIAGITLQLEVSYSNYYAAAPRLGRYAGSGTLDPQVVTYAFKVTEVPTIGVQQFETVTADGSLMPNRTVYQRQGIRILVTQVRAQWGARVRRCCGWLHRADLSPTVQPCTVCLACRAAKSVGSTSRRCC